MSDCAAARLRLVLFAVVISTVILPSRNTSAQSADAAPTINGPDLTSSAYLPGPVVDGKPTGDQYPWGQCTWYAWGRAKENDDAPLNRFGNATNWASAITSQQPRAHSIAVWQNAIKGDGHVAYVEKVEGDKIFITEANFYNFRPSLDNYAKDWIGGGFDGCHILTKAQMAKRPVAQKVEKTEGDLILKGYIYLPVASSSTSSGPNYTCSSAKSLLIAKTEGFSHAQNGNQVTLTFRGEGFQQGAKVMAQGIEWSSDEISVTSITPDGKELVAVLGVQDAAKFTVAIQNPDMERSKPQELSVVAAPPVQVANAQPVPAEEPASTPETAPGVPSAAVFPASTAAPETAAPATSPEPVPDTIAASALQQVTIPPAATAQPAQQPAENQTPTQAPAQAPEQASAPPQAAAPAEQPAAEAPQAAGQAPAASATSLAPVLLRITPGNHAPGQFTVDLYGLNFQDGAKIVVQGLDWSSDQAAVNFLGANHLQATIVAQNAAQITIAVQNPDAQTSGARRFVIGQPQATIATSGPAAGTAPTTTANAAIATPSTTGTASPTSPAGATPAPSTPASVATGASPGTTSAQPVTETTRAVAPATAGSTPTAISTSAAMKNPASAASANTTGIPPLLPRGGTTNYGSTIAVAPTTGSAPAPAKNPIAGPSALTGMSGPTRKIQISAIGGWSSSDRQEVVNAQWLGQPPEAPNHGHYYKDYAIDSSPGLSYWTFTGSGFGTKQGTILFSDAAIQSAIKSWTDTEIRIDLKVPYTYTSNKNVRITITAADGANVGMSVPVIGTISTRGYGQCTWYVANQLLSHNLPIPMGAYQASGQINPQYVPQQWDVVDFNQGHTAIIVSQPAQTKVANGDGTDTITYSFTIGEMNADWGEHESTASSKFVVKVDKSGNRTVVQGITSGVKKPATTYFSSLPRSAPATIAGSATPSTSSPVLRAAGTALKAGDNTDLIGENFTHNSRVSLLLTAPGAAETFLVSFTSDANGGFHYPYAAACDAKAGAYSIRALDQAPAGSGITGRKSTPLALTVVGKATHCILGIPAAQASSKPSGPPPVLNPVSPASHAAGQFSIELYGSGFQPGAKVLVQSNGRNDQVSAMYVAPDHLRAMMNAPSAAQFTVAVQNPDAQTSASQPFQVTQASAVIGPKANGPTSTTPVRAPTPIPTTTTAPNGPVAVNPPAGPVSPIRPIPLSSPTPVVRPVSPVISSGPGKPAPSATPQLRPLPQPTPVIYSGPTAAKPQPYPTPAVGPATVPVKPPVLTTSPTPVKTVTAAPGPLSQPPRAIATPTPAFRPTPTPAFRPQPQPPSTPVRVMPTPTPVPRVAAPPPPPPRPVATPPQAPRPAQPAPTPAPTKSPTPKKP